MTITIKAIARASRGSVPALRIANTALLLALCLCAGSAAAAGTGVTRARYVMGTVCEITARGPGAGPGIEAAFGELERWDRLLSLYKEDSEASRMNREAARAPFAASDGLWEAVSAALEMARRAEGLFDPTLQPRGYTQVRLDPVRRTVRFMKAGLRLDFGGIGKGLALDHAVRRLKAHGVSEALLNFGGQVSALGAWTVESAAGPLSIRDASVSTSGDGERPGHILSPLTGLPVRGPDVTVIAPTGAEADAWSTALYVAGGRLPPAFTACSLCRYVNKGEYQ
ncbi:MAG: thiamine biosynthesis lipoprotein [Elusimicrobia bacterium]|nr:MAG: thiamine biosynthesis lipoprotein [Elusimicrobiota bacterium]KAF0152058.1 MAG: thiamine biosynthesis lipoprotein [Elusimicrobiota bacterium]